MNKEQLCCHKSNPIFAYINLEMPRGLGGCNLKIECGGFANSELECKNGYNLQRWNNYMRMLEFNYITNNPPDYKEIPITSSESTAEFLFSLKEQVEIYMNSLLKKVQSIIND